MTHSRSFLCSRVMLFGVFLLSVGAAVFSLYIQQYHAMIPCPLCILERYSLFFVLLFSGVGLLVPKRAIPVCAAAACLCATVGLALSLWHVYIQARPTRMELCSVGLEHMLNHTALATALPRIFAGYGSCSVIPWRLLHIITLPMISAAYCTLQMLLSAWSLHLTHRSCSPSHCHPH